MRDGLSARFVISLRAGAGDRRGNAVRRSAARSGAGCGEAAVRRLRTIIEGNTMLKWALIFLVISLIAGALGFTGIARGAATIAKVLFGIFLILFVIFLILGLTVVNVAT
jgi:uncharacterized membrane protein YtjA (UPF0391 family)